MMSRENGTQIQTELNHIKQSIQDILTTPIGSRVMRREYGSLLFKMIDAPTNQTTLLQLYAATVTALLQWENRIDIESVSMSSLEIGSFDLDINFKLKDQQENQSLKIPLNFGSLL